MLDEDEEGSGLNSLGEVLMGYGERYFEGGGASAGAEGQAQAKGRTGLWASVLLMTGQFERVCLRYLCRLCRHFPLSVALV